MKKIHNKQKRKKVKTHIQKPKGSRFTEEVKQLEPQNVGVIPIDVHKDKHQILICDYYGKILKDEFSIPNTLTGVQVLLTHICEVIDKFNLKKVYAVMEYTGKYHQNLANKLRQHKISVVFVLPNSTYHLRQGQMNWAKTDSIDLCAIGQAFVNGWVSSCPPLDDFYQNWQTLTRARRDEVNLQTQAKNRITDLLHDLMPGCQELFANFWEHNAPPVLLSLAHSPEQLLNLNRITLIQQLSKAKVQKPAELVDKLHIWAKNSLGTSSNPSAKIQQLKILWQHFLNYQNNIRSYNISIAQYLSQNPALLFLSIPWVNVPSASEYASEIGPFDNFTSPKQITAYLGLAPKKFQTGKISFENGPITRKGKNRGRADPYSPPTPHTDFKV
ncbi:MAG: transposase [bacterium]